jgi:hypothetical protein
MADDEAVRTAQDLEPAEVPGTLPARPAGMHQTVVGRDDDLAVVPDERPPELVTGRLPVDAAEREAQRQPNDDRVAAEPFRRVHLGLVEVGATFKVIRPARERQPDEVAEHRELMAAERRSLVRGIEIGGERRAVVVQHGSAVPRQ